MGFFLRVVLNKSKGGNSYELKANCISASIHNMQMKKKGIAQ